MISIAEKYASYEKDIFSRCRYIRFADAELPVISPEDLFIIKTASSRKQDKLDAENMIQELGTSLDMDYIQKQRGLIENPGQGGGGEK